MTDERPQLDDAEIEAAFRTIGHQLPSSLPPAGFLRRVMTAARRAPLPAGRQKLRSSRRAIVAGLAGVAATAGVVTLVWVTELLQVLIAQIFLVAVDVGVLAIRSVSFMLDVWRFLDRLAQVLTTVLSSPEMLSVVGAAAVLSVLSVTALAHLVSSSQTLTQRESIKW